MTFSKPWVDMKRVAFVPVFRESPDVVPPDVIPDNWGEAILNRVINDIRPAAGGVDRSLRAWLQRVSWGKANIDPKVFKMRKVTQKEVAPNHFAGEDNPDPEQSLNRDHLDAQGFSAAILIMLGGAGTGTTDANGFWSRVAWVEKNGTWLHELLHAITNFQDLYHFNNDVDPEDRGIKLFDIMSASQQTHPTAFTKNEFGWLDDRAIGRYTIGSGDRGFILHHVDSLRPPTHSGEVYAIRIGDNVPYIMVEARKKTDHWETGISVGEMGIPDEGIIIYRVRTKDPTIQKRTNCRKSIYRENLTALQPGNSVTIGNAIVRVVSELPGGIGYSIQVTTDPTPVPGIGQVLVPNVVGMDWEDAEKAMVQAGICTRMSGPEGPKDNPTKIQSQELPGGTLALFGTEIILKRSPPPQTCPAGQHFDTTLGQCVPDVIMVAVPNVTHPSLHPSTAKSKIENKGLIANMVGCSGPNCRVTTQDPLPGTQVPKDSTVTCNSEDITL